MKDMALFAALDHLGHFSDGKRLPVQVPVMPCDTFHPEKINGDEAQPDVGLYPGPGQDPV